MNNYWKIYWLTRLDYIQGFFAGVAILIIMSYIIYSIVNYVENDVRPKRKTIISVAVTVCLLSLISALTPNKKEMILIYAGGKTLDFVAKDSSLNKLPAQTTAIISEYLDKQINELKKK